ncbi:MAG TPA: diguanylate phosphodiesterase, partial [Phenylobacterium sp.]|nr:diguanylate phosphodiesterase [Phenylobacterium sp.]
LDLDIGLAQGHLFGEPRAIKDSVLSESGPPPATVVQMPQRRAAVG